MLIAYNIVNVLSMFMAVVTVGADVDFGFPAAAEENPRLRHPEVCEYMDNIEYVPG